MPRNPFNPVATIINGMIVAIIIANSFKELLKRNSARKLMIS